MNSVFASNLNGAGSAIAILLPRHPLQSDVNNFDQQFSVPATSLSQTFLNGACAVPCPNPTTPADVSEASQDAEWAHAAAPGAKIDTISVHDDFTPSFLVGAEYIVNNLAQNVQTVSFSYAGCEYGPSSFNHAAWSAVVDQGILEGQVWVIASGDYGAAGCFDSQIASVAFPASIPEVVAAGASSIDPPITMGNVTGYGPEQVANDLGCSSPPYGSIVSGGGQSVYFPKPSWQFGKTTNDSVRDVPDIAINGDYSIQTTFPANCVEGAGYWISVINQWGHGGGTSISAPIWAGLFAILEQKNAGALGLVLPQLYGLQNSAAFHQITTGNNFFPPINNCCTAGSGYNMVTGLGTPDVAQLVSDFPLGPYPSPKPTSFPIPVPVVFSTPPTTPTSYALIPSNEDGAMYVFNTTPGASQGSLVKSLSGLMVPIDVGFNSKGSTAYVLQDTGFIGTLNTTTFSLNSSKYNSLVAEPGGLAITGLSAYVTDRLNRQLVGVPLGGVTAPQTIPVGYDPSTSAVNPSNGDLYVANAGDNTVSIINPTTAKVIQTVVVGMHPGRMAATGKTLVVANQGDGTVTLINVGVNPATVTATAFVGGEPMGVAINGNKSLAFISNYFCPGPAAMCNPDGHTAIGSIEVVKLNGLPPKVECCIVVGQLPGAEAFDPSGQFLWVINEGSQSLSLIDTFHDLVLGSETVSGPGGEYWGSSDGFLHVVP